MGEGHLPVLVDEVIASLGVGPGSSVADCTVGGGGHAERLLEASSPDGRLLGIDADRAAISEASRNLAPFGDRVVLVNANFAALSPGCEIRLITANAGLAKPDLHVGPVELTAFGGVDIHEDDPRYHTPLKRDARKLAGQLVHDGCAVLLGSIATAKYRDVLLECFGERLMFPADFVGRGDMSRGALLLRAAAAGEELNYIPVAGAITRGRRAPSIREPSRKKPKRDAK